MLNGRVSLSITRGVSIVLLILIVAVTAIILWGKTVPDAFITGISVLIGFLIGSQIKPKPETEVQHE